MAILKIARMGHPVLARVADPLPDPTAPEVAALVEDMLDTLADAGGVGLAAPQVHESWRLVIFHVPAQRAEDGVGVPLTVLVNPVIEPIGEDMVEDWEGCLSIPGFNGRVSRHARIRYSALGLDGEPFEREASGFHARVVQHECDHLDGRLYPMRMDDLSKFGFSEDILRNPQMETADHDG
ncbi:peptide deformylase [Magnetospira sp. QH-2]|uniref:peptide deformylase n=1 Tax=Magnetospira sp. (strain QH-2) TaxID=1288970 RepID=UPI0003E810BC|nr:peptide deformylase [Magnetospira sp. QH-2]CCQ74374.1 Peptide deformylase(Polypeptide deformylase) [Magnetospira sp. QH-2]